MLTISRTQFRKKGTLGSFEHKDACDSVNSKKPETYYIDDRKVTVFDKRCCIKSKTIRDARREGQAFTVLPDLPLSNFLDFIPEHCREIALSKLVTNDVSADASNAAIAKYIALEEKLPGIVDNPLLSVSRSLLSIILRRFRKHDYLYLGHGASVSSIIPKKRKSEMDNTIYYVDSRNLVTDCKCFKSKTVFSAGDKVSKLKWTSNDVTLFSELFTCPEIITANLEIDPYARWSKLTTVPKKREIARCINIEGVLPKALQHVIGCNLREEFRIFGLKYGFSTDLNTCSIDNAFKAYQGSKYGGIATVDFSSASDSLSVVLIESLFKDNGPMCEKYWKLMSEVRSTHVLVGGRPILTKKFASMGNAFIFELESIVFFVIVLAYEITIRYPLIPLLGRQHLRRKLVQILKSDESLKHVSTFGDDTICSSDIDQEYFRKYLEDHGLTMNPDKSFFEGPFRESCGYDFSDGRFVREFYLKHLTIMDYMRMLNYYTLNRRLYLSDAELEYIKELIPSVFWCSRNNLPFVKYANTNARFHKNVPDGYLIVDVPGYRPKVLLEYASSQAKTRKRDAFVTATLIMYATMCGIESERPSLRYKVKSIGNYEVMWSVVTEDPVAREIDKFESLLKDSQ